MKVILQNHDAVIQYDLQPKITEPANEGEMVNHKQVVSAVYYSRQRVDVGGNVVFDRIYLSKEFIVEAYNEIQAIESKIVQAPYSSLPF